MASATESGSRARQLKDRAMVEAREFVRIFVYLWSMLSLFALYTSLLEPRTDTWYLAFSFALLEAVIGAKVILVGQRWAFIRKFEDRPLIYPTLYKTGAFLLLMMWSAVVEKCVDGLIHHKPLLLTFASGAHVSMLLAKNLVIVLSLIPFFAIRELARVEGHNLVYRLFIHPGPQGARCPAQDDPVPCPVSPSGDPVQ